jgi:Holliday junction resolvase RusA-like endonuclease
MDAHEITFEVPGQPVPQPRPRVSTRGGFARAYVPKAHAIHAYREAVRLLATTNGWRDGAATGPVAVEIDCYLERPVSHLTKAGEVRSSAPKYPGRSDVDNLAKAVLDAITDAGTLWQDDDQVVELVVRKAYARPLAGGRTIVTVRRPPP